MSRRIVDHGSRREETSSRALYFLRTERMLRPNMASLAAQREARERDPQSRLRAFYRIAQSGRDTP